MDSNEKEKTVLTNNLDLNREKLDKDLKRDSVNKTDTKRGDNKRPTVKAGDVIRSENKKDTVKEEKKVGAEIQQFQSEIRQLQDENTKNLTRISNLETQITDLKEHNAILSESVSNATQELQGLKESFEKKVEEKQKEIREKEKTITVITQTNTKLLQSLDELKKEVDTHLDKVSFNKVKTRIEETKQNPLEIVLKVKEKELKNSNQLIEILRKDNEQLQKAVDTYTDYKSIFKIQDKLTLKEREVVDLLSEIKVLNKAIEDHKRCPSLKNSLENEIKNLKADLRHFKDTHKELKDKMKEEEKKHQSTRDQYLNLKKENDAKRKIKMNDSAAINKLVSNYGLSEETIKKEKIDVNKIHKLNHDSNLAGLLIQSGENTETVELKNKKISDKFFSFEDRSKIEKLLPKDDIIKYERKFEAVENSKSSIENKSKSDNRLFNKKLRQMEEQLEFLTLQMKESEQKNKILQFQVNEYKNEHRIYQKKLTETQGMIEQMSQTLREKEQENKILLNQMNSMRKVIKHNAVPPLDDDLVRHLNKIKNELEDADSNQSGQDYIDNNMEIEII
jgi:chromosome segregation ATPase